MWDGAVEGDAPLRCGNGLNNISCWRHSGKLMEGGSLIILSDFFCSFLLSSELFTSDLSHVDQHEDSNSQS